MSCSVNSCMRETEAKGLCSTHYSRFMRHGDPLVKLKPGNKPGDQLANAMRHIVKNANEVGCWAWTGGTKGNGYGVMTLSAPKRRTERVYRFMYETFYGPVENGMHLDHFMYPQDGCIGPNCCNPDHVRPVTPKENTLRSSAPSAINAQKTHCINGHEFTEDNTYRRPSRWHERECRKCKAMRARKAYRNDI